MMTRFQWTIAVLLVAAACTPVSAQCVNGNCSAFRPLYKVNKVYDHLEMPVRQTVPLPPKGAADKYGYVQPMQTNGTAPYVDKITVPINVNKIKVRSTASTSGTYSPAGANSIPVGLPVQGKGQKLTEHQLKLLADGPGNSIPVGLPTQGKGRKLTEHQLKLLADGPGNR